jgi:hypothetical protein
MLEEVYKRFEDDWPKDLTKANGKFNVNLKDRLLWWNSKDTKRY